MVWTLREVELRYGARSRVEAGRRVASSRDVVEVVHDADAEIGCASGIEERVVVLALDAKNRVVGWHLAGKGGVTSCPADVGAILRPVLVAGAAGLVLVHNHPSGEPAPSGDDVALTDKVHRASKLLDLALLDHVIVTANRAKYFSFLDAGLLSSRA